MQTRDYQNFRITENDYHFQLKVVSGGSGFYDVWLEGNDYVYLAIAQSPDTVSTALSFDYQVSGFPAPVGDNSNYRIDTNGDFQLLNTTTGKYHTIAIGGTIDNPTFAINQIGVA